MKVIPVTAVAIMISGHALNGASVGWASPTSTDPLQGEYLKTTLSSVLEGDVGRTRKVTFTPCGQDCTHWLIEGGDPKYGFNLYLQGDKWIRDPSGGALMIIESDSLKGYAASTYGEVPTHETFVLTKI